MLPKLPAVSDKPYHDRTRPTPNDLSKPSSEIARSNLIFSSSTSASVQSDSLEEDWQDTHSMPLGPRWHDYTYREGDAFYGATSSPTDTLDITIKTLSSTEVTSGNAWDVSLQRMSIAVSAIRRNLLSTLYTRPVESTTPGFQVVRPARGGLAHERDEELAGRSPSYPH